MLHISPVQFRLGNRGVGTRNSVPVEPGGERVVCSLVPLDGAKSGGLAADSWRRRTEFRGEGEYDSGLKANSDSGGKANGFHPIKEWLSRCPE